MIGEKLEIQAVNFPPTIKTEELPISQVTGTVSPEDLELKAIQSQLKLGKPKDFVDGSITTRVYDLFSGAQQVGAIKAVVKNE